MTIRQTIRRYMLENFLFTDADSELQDDASFLTQGIIDSVGALEITSFIEETFQIRVQESEMLPENLDSVNNLVAFVERKQAQPG